MEAVFLKLLNMSITASWLVFAVFLLRILFRKAPKFVSMLLWALVGIRLVCPFSLKSILSVIPNPEPVPSEILTAEHPVIQSGISAVNETMNPVLSETFAPSAETGASPLGSLAFIASFLWLCGIVVRQSVIGEFTKASAKRRCIKAMFGFVTVLTRPLFSGCFARGCSCRLI